MSILSGSGYWPHETSCTMCGKLNINHTPSEATDCLVKLDNLKYEQDLFNKSQGVFKRLAGAALKIIDENSQDLLNHSKVLAKYMEKLEDIDKRLRVIESKVQNKEIDDNLKELEKNR